MVNFSASGKTTKDLFTKMTVKGLVRRLGRLLIHDSIVLPVVTGNTEIIVLEGHGFFAMPEAATAAISMFR